MSSSTEGLALVALDGRRCAEGTCPFCHLLLPHGATATDALANLESRLVSLRDEQRRGIHKYLQDAAAAKLIVTQQGVGKFHLPGASESPCEVDVSTEAAWAIVLTGGGRTTFGNQRGTASSSTSRGDRAGWDWSGQDAWCERDAHTVRKRTYLPADEYPQWQFKSGQAKKKWTTYDRDSNDRLEAAFVRGVRQMGLELDEWEYEIDFTNLTQTSTTTSSVRPIRRLSRPPTDS